MAPSCRVVSKASPAARKTPIVKAQQVTPSKRKGNQSKKPVEEQECVDLHRLGVFLFDQSTALYLLAVSLMRRIWCRVRFLQSQVSSTVNTMNGLSPD
jgi:hypothetical protein